MMVDPKNPQIVYASLWTFRRTGWSFESGGDKSGLFKSNDGGATWSKIQKGFDGQMLGRICLALAPSAPNNLYAIAEAKKLLCIVRKMVVKTGPSKATIKM
nr:hypothetical protein [Bacteroidota bacterium]